MDSDDRDPNVLRALDKIRAIHRETGIPYDVLLADANPHAGDPPSPARKRRRRRRRRGRRGGRNRTRRETRVDEQHTRRLVRLTPHKGESHGTGNAPPCEEPTHRPSRPP